MAIYVLLSDRTPDEALPALAAPAADPKHEELSAAGLEHALALGPDALFIDAAENPGQGHHLLRMLRDRDARVPAIAIVERADLERFSWDEVAEELLFPGAPAAEIRLRLTMLRRRHGAAGGSVLHLGPLALDLDSYRVTLATRPLDLTYKEFELLRFLAERPGRVFTRPALLREVWGYDFYGGTRTVDVHVRRLRSKLGPEHEQLIGTVRGVGYRAVVPEES
ncbi:MAG: winged-helix domain-containing protein [Actinomycetota bacterium]